MKMEENGLRVPEQSKPSRESRLRNVKERQNEERQRKLEEIKAQVLAAQVFKEQKEQERRRRLEEMRIRDNDRRQQVEERKKAINEAERDRLEYILKRNQERDHLIERKKKHEKSNLVFAFGSSTPRLLDSTDTSISYWATRRATSIQNIASINPASTVNQSEDLDVGSKKRASSATGLERTGAIATGILNNFVGRRRTDLVPTIPIKDSGISSSQKSLNTSPGRAYSMTRLDQLAKPRKRHDVQSSSSSNTGSTRNLALDKADSRSMQQLNDKQITTKPRPNRTTQLRDQKLLTSSNGSEASSRPSSSLSQQSTSSVASSITMRHRVTAGPRKSRPVSIAVTGVSTDLKLESKPPLPKKSSEKIVITKNRPKTPENCVFTFTKPVVKNITTKDESKTISDKAANGNQKSEINNVPPSEPKPVNGKLESILNVSNKSNVEIVVDDTTLVNANIVKDIKDLEQASLIDIQSNISEETHKEDIYVEKPQIDVPTEKTSQPEDTLANLTENTPQVIQETLVEKTPLSVENIPPSTEESQASIIEEFLRNERIPPYAEITQQTDKSLNENHPQPTKKKQTDKTNQPAEKSLQSDEKTFQSTEEPTQPLVVKTSQLTEKIEIVEKSENHLQHEDENDAINEMTSSMTKSRITTEQEAKAAIAERRRQIREEAERQAELERQRIEAEAKAELERQRQEEEQMRQLIELQKKNEQERLQEAIREAQKQEEEERIRREEEQALKLLKEESEKRAREEAERQKVELQEKLKNEEKEREARRKRVEAIMLRTRGKNNANLAPLNSDEKNGNKSQDIKDSIKIEERENGTTKLDDDIVDNFHHTYRN